MTRTSRSPAGDVQSTSNNNCERNRQMISSADQPDELDRSGTRLLDGLHDHEASPDDRRVVVCARRCV